MQQLSDILPAAMSLPDSPKGPQHGLTTSDGQTSQLLILRQHPLTEGQLTAIACHVLRQPFLITFEEKTKYGRKMFSDEFGSHLMDNQPIGKEVFVDCIVDINPTVTNAMLKSALMVSPVDACVKHLTHLSLHKKFGSNDHDRPVMLADYVRALHGYPEFIIYQVCRHYWQNDRRPFIPFIAEMTETCEIFKKALERSLTSNLLVEKYNPQPAEQKSKTIDLEEEKKSELTEEEKQKIHNMILEFENSLGSA